MLETFPEEVNQVTPTFDELVTTAVNCVDAPDATVMLVGVMLTATAAMTVRVKDFDEVCLGEEESVALTVILNEPVFEVVPEIDPDDCKVIPVGREPDESVHVYGVLPPVAVKVFEYEVPAVAFDNDVVVMLTGGGGGGVTVTDAVADLVESATLVAVTVVVVVTVTVGAV